MRATRREMLGGAAALGVAPGLSATAWSMPERHSLDLRPRAFVIDGAPTWLTFGCIDYFRIPRAEWRDTLLRARRGGINAVAFYVAWNVHERTPGTFDFTGDADIGAFLDVAASLGMWAFPRVGPFICAEWEGGGYPAWLIAQPDIQLRADHGPTLALVRRWFSRLVPIIAARQATRGGPVVMVQAENEYFFVGRPGTDAYLATLTGYLRELGIEVPVTDCNGARVDMRGGNTMATLNGGGAGDVMTLHRVQPNKPAVISELYTDYITMWGWPANSYPTVGRMRDQVMDTLAAGGMWSYFMYAGGTNFGFAASTSWKSDQSFVTTRYYNRCPVHEGGAMTASYAPAKAANQIAANLSSWLCAAVDAPVPFALSGPVIARAAGSPTGTIVFVTPAQPVRDDAVFHTDNSGGPLIQLAEEFPQSEIAAEAGVAMLGGVGLPLAAPSSVSLALPFALRIDQGRTIDHANATLLGLAGSPERRIVVLTGEAGREGHVSVNGHAAAFVFAETPVMLRAGGATVLALSNAAAERAWFVDGRLIVGAAYVGEARAGGHECFLDGRTAAITTVARDGAVTTHAVPTSADTSARIALGPWTAHALAEPRAADGWTALDAPRSVERLGQDQGYTWYRAHLSLPAQRTTALFPTAAKDRLTVFVNGARQGVWGRGPGATRDPLPVRLNAGDNTIVFLADNMGRRSEGVELDPKGIFGPVHADAAILPLPAPEASAVAAPPTNSWRYQTYRHFYPDAPLTRVSFTVPPRAGNGLTLSLRWVPQFVWIAVDGAIVAEHGGDFALVDGFAFSDTVLDRYLKHSPARIDLTYVGEPSADHARHIRLIGYPRGGELGQWGFRGWADPVGSVRPQPGDPALWRCDFAMPQAPAPFFLEMQGLSKGHAWLNGRALGRYWEVGPQHSLYVPHSWMRAQNRLTILDEDGHRPDKVALVRDVRVPTRSIIL